MLSGRTGPRLVCTADGRLFALGGTARYDPGLAYDDEDGFELSTVQ